MPDILQQQIEYYRARATEYNEWWYRQGRYDRGEDLNQQWFDEAAQVREALLRLPRQGHILELAAGTGIWTRELLEIGSAVTAVDASPEMLTINKLEVGSDRVAYVRADIFTWQPPQQYDMVFFGFWLSHVPPERLLRFLKGVWAMLRPGGILFMVDSRRAPESTAVDNTIPAEGTTLQRTLNDGRSFEIIKVFYEPDTLESAFAASGIAAEVAVSDNFFIYAQGSKPTGAAG